MPVVYVANNQDLNKAFADAGRKLVVIGFFSSSRKPSKDISEHFHQLSEQYKDSALFAKVDVDVEKQVSNAYNITSTPTFHYHKFSNSLGHITGSSPRLLSATTAHHIRTSDPWVL